MSNQGTDRKGQHIFFLLSFITFNTLKQIPVRKSANRIHIFASQAVSKKGVSLLGARK